MMLLGSVWFWLLARGGMGVHFCFVHVGGRLPLHTMDLQQEEKTCRPALALTRYEGINNTI
eukprot:1656562-Amphidinium_carterae.1